VVTRQLQVERRTGKFAGQRVRLTLYRCTTQPIIEHLKLLVCWKLIGHDIINWAVGQFQEQLPLIIAAGDVQLELLVGYYIHIVAMVCSVFCIYVALNKIVPPCIDSIWDKRQWKSLQNYFDDFL